MSCKTTLHAARNFDAHKIQSLDQRLPDKIDNQNVEELPVRILFRDDAIAVVKEIESLRERERIFRERCRLERDHNLMGNFVEAQREVHQFPNVVRFVEKCCQLRIVQHFLNAGEVEGGIAFAQLEEDVVG